VSATDETVANIFEDEVYQQKRHAGYGSQGKTTTNHTVSIYRTAESLLQVSVVAIANMHPPNTILRVSVCVIRADSNGNTLNVTKLLLNTKQRWHLSLTHGLRSFYVLAILIVALFLVAFPIAFAQVLILSDIGSGEWRSSWNCLQFVVVEEIDCPRQLELIFLPLGGIVVLCSRIADH
jgi:hypothetical protein